MHLFGLLWVLSWIGNFLSSNHSLPAMTLKLSPTKSVNLDKLVSKPDSFFVPLKQQVNVWNATLLPTSFLKMDWGNKESKAIAKPPNPSVTELHRSNRKFCGSVQEILALPPTVKTTGTLIEPSLPNRDFLPSKILRSLQNFFHFSNHSEQSLSLRASFPVVVVHRDENNYEVWANNRLIASLPNKIQANVMQERLGRLLKTSNLDGTQLRPAFVDGMPALMTGNRFLFGIDKEVSRKANRSGDLLAIEWVNNLRTALQAPVLSLVEGQLQMYGLTASKQKLSGTASWYGGYFHGRQTANGEIYNQDELTVAHKSLPFNTYLQVTSQKTGKAVIVRVNDRGPYIPPRSLDLSRVAARCINSEVAGVVSYDAVILSPSGAKMTLNANKIDTSKLKPTRKLAVISDF